MIGAGKNVNPKFLSTTYLYSHTFFVDFFPVFTYLRRISRGKVHISKEQSRDEESPTHHHFIFHFRFTFSFCVC